MRRSIYGIFALVMVLSMMLSACTTPTVVPTTAPMETTAAPMEPTSIPDQTDGIELPFVDPASLSGKIYAAGSSTVYPLAEAIAEQFRADGYAGELKIDSVGTGGGMERFCKTAETDIANASRKIKAGEIENCAAVNRTPIQFLVGLDALAIVINKENDFIKDLTLADLAKIFSDQSVKWSDINPEWPAEDIKRFAPGTDSGTFDFFVEAVLAPAYDKDLDKSKEAFLKAANLESSEDDNVLVQAGASSSCASGSTYGRGFGRILTSGSDATSSSADTGFWTPKILRISCACASEAMRLPPSMSLMTASVLVYLLLMRRGPLGSLSLLFTVKGMVLAQILIITPIISGMVYAHAARSAPAIRQFARTMGASKWQTDLLMITEMKHEIYFAIVAGFGRSISEVGAVMLVGGNIKGSTRTMTTAISLLKSQGIFTEGVTLGLLLLLMAFILQWMADYFQKEESSDENY